MKPRSIGQYGSFQARGWNHMRRLQGLMHRIAQALVLAHFL